MAMVALDHREEQACTIKGFILKLVPVFILLAHLAVLKQRKEQLYLKKRNHQHSCHVHHVRANKGRTFQKMLELKSLVLRSVQLELHLGLESRSVVFFRKQHQSKDVFVSSFLRKIIQLVHFQFRHRARIYNLTF